MDNTGAGRLWTQHSEKSRLPYYFHAAILFFLRRGSFMKNKTVRTLTECAVMIALATVLSLIKIVDLPAGGSVTIASMLPVAVIAYRHGLGWGLGAGLVHGAIQQLLGLNSLSWVTGWQSILAVVLLDYIVAFAVVGFAGVFRRSVKDQATGLTLGCILACVLRYACHVISGATVWAGLSIPTQAALGYSFIYNATFMIPETIVLVVAALYIGSTVDFRAEMPTRMRREAAAKGTGWLAPVAGLVVTAAVIFDVAAVFSHLQDAESGEFAITQITEVNWLAVVIVTVVAAVIAAVLLGIRSSMKRREA